MKLRLDYDCNKEAMQTKFHNGLIALNRVRQSKSNRPIFITVTKVEKTRKGWHIYAIYRDDITDIRGMWTSAIGSMADRCDTLILQSIFDSDRTRTAFDRRRVFLKEPIYNLMATYKNGQQFVRDEKLEEKLNDIIIEALVD